MPEEYMNQEFRLKKIDEIRNYLIQEINRNELMNKKHKNVCRVLNYTDLLLVVIFKITGCRSIPAFASLVGIPIGVASFTIGLKICLITAGIKKYKSIIEKKRKKHDKIVFLVKYKLISMKVVISKTLIDSNIRIDEFVLVNNVMKEFYDMKEEIETLKINKNLNYVKKNVIL